MATGWSSTMASTDVSGYQITLLPMQTCALNAGWGMHDVPPYQVMQASAHQA